MLQSGYVEMDGIYAYLSPLDEDLVAASKQASEVLESKEIKPPEQPVPDVTNASRQKPTNGSAAAPSPLQQGHRAVNHRMKLAADSMPQHNQKLMLLQVGRHGDLVVAGLLA